MQDFRKKRFVFEVPWHSLDAVSQARAMEFANDIVFSDQSRVLWDGSTWQVANDEGVPLAKSEAARFVKAAARSD